MLWKENSGAESSFYKWLIVDDKNFSDLRVKVLLKFQLLFEGLDAILSIHSPQHLILQLLSDIAQTGIQLRRDKN